MYSQKITNRRTRGKQQDRHLALEEVEKNVKYSELKQKHFKTLSLVQAVMTEYHTLALVGLNKRNYFSHF